MVLQWKSYNMFQLIPQIFITLRSYLFETLIEKCTFEDNFIPFNEGGPILDFISAEVSIKDCTFTGSNTTVISLRNTYVNLFGDILFQNNKARVGGALKICDASLVFAYSGTQVRFVNNSALEGGAIYVQQACMDTWPLCPIQLAMPRNIPALEFVKVMKFEFINNSATIAGDAVYGGSLDRSMYHNRSYHTNGIAQILKSITSYYWYSKEIFTQIFDTREQLGSSWITSDPFGVCFCQGSQEYNMSCVTNLKPEDGYYPGEEITVSMITVGQMNGSTSGMIQATLLGEDHYQHSLTQSSLPQTSAKCVNLTYVLNSNKRNAQISFKPVSITIASR
jgi:predicted outer membrane repeat protein